LELAYTSNERGGGITAWDFDPTNGTLTEQQTLSTLPPEYSGESAAADIKITANGRFAYVSNRDITKRKSGESMQDTIAAIALDQKTGRMKVIGHYSTVHFPRSFCIDLTGNFLYVAGQQAAAMAAYRIDQKTGKLKRLAEYETGDVPIWVMCGTVE
jgi:6-phosphogluconolactonase